MSEAKLPAPTATQQTLLARILQEQIAVLKSFLTALDAERRALHSNDPAAIEAAVTEKNRIADQLQGFERQKLRVVASTVAGAESEQKAVLTAWQRLPPLADAWHAVCQLARQCQERNQENGVLLREKQHFVQQALDVLLHSQERLNIYDDKGQSRLTLTGHSRKIGSA